MGKPRFTFSPAMVVACLALLVALSGTGFAAYKVTAPAPPRNSVGTLQLKNDAVTSAKIKNGSVAAVDLAPGAKTSGPAGPAGPAGAAGPAGPAGPSDAYSIAVRGPVAVPVNTTTLTTLASLSIPQAGKYVISAKALFSVDTGTSSAFCDVVAGSDFDESGARAQVGAVDQPGTLANGLVHEFTAPGTVDYQCGAEAPGNLTFIRVTAIKVGNLTASG